MIVLDCNAAVALALNSKEGRALRSLITDNETVIAPTLLYAELSSALSRYVRSGILTSQNAVQLGRAAIGLVDRFYSGEELWEEALSESARLNHSAYDMQYLVLSRRKAATLFTLDKALQKLALENGVNALTLVALE